MLPAVTDSATINLELNIIDRKFKLDRINILLNDVPIYGIAGINVKKELKKAVV